MSPFPAAFYPQATQIALEIQPHLSDFAIDRKSMEGNRNAHSQEHTSHIPRAVDITDHFGNGSRVVPKAFPKGKEVMVIANSQILSHQIHPVDQQRSLQRSPTMSWSTLNIHRDDRQHSPNPPSNTAGRREPVSRSTHSGILSASSRCRQAVTT